MQRCPHALMPSLLRSEPSPPSARWGQQLLALAAFGAAPALASAGRSSVPDGTADGWMSFTPLSWSSGCGDGIFLSFLPSLLSLSVNAIVLNQLTATLPGLVSPQPPLRAGTPTGQEQPGTRSQQAAPPFRAASRRPWRATSCSRGCPWPARLLPQGGYPPAHSRPLGVAPQRQGCSAAPGSFAAARLLPSAVRCFSPGGLEDEERV